MGSTMRGGTADSTAAMTVGLPVMKKFKSELKKTRTLRPVFEIDIKEVEIKEKLSEGAFGIIYKAQWRGLTVAVKTIKQELIKEETIKDFLSKLSRRVLRYGVIEASQHCALPWRVHEVAREPGDRNRVLPQQQPVDLPLRQAQSAFVATAA